jgi:hypothetical protein
VPTPATKNENETAEIAQTAESYFFSAPAALSAVIYTGITHVRWHATKKENEGSGACLFHPFTPSPPHPFIFKVTTQA